MKKLSETLKAVTWYVFLSILLLYCGVVGFWLWYPYVPIAIIPYSDKGAIQIMNTDKKVLAGHELIYKLTYDKKMKIHGLLTRKLVNNFKLELRDSITTAPIGKDIDKIPITIPLFSPPGKYRLWWSVSYEVNPIRTVIVSAESEEFEVISDLDIFKGKQGEQGKQGPAGPVGQQGKVGETGKKGGVTIFGK